MNGNSTGAEPVAMTMFLAVSWILLPAGSPSFAAAATGKPPWSSRVISTVLAETNEAAPVKIVILRALASWPTPPTSFATTASFFFIIVAKSTSTEPSLMPCAVACDLAKVTCSLEWSSALLGMQPTLRQVPPSVGRLSISATLRPSCCARKAQT